MSKAIDLDTLRAGGAAEARLMTLVEAACLSALDTRSHLLCVLSAESEEWSDGESLVDLSKEYRCLMAVAWRTARDGWNNPEDVVNAMMERLAEREGWPTTLPWMGNGA